MAAFRTVVLLAVCVFLILAFCVPETDSRGSRDARIREGDRIHNGTRIYSSNTWKAAVLSGAIYGGARYMRGSYYRRYPNRMPTICTNRHDLAPNRRVYGNFICPLENDPVRYNWCCGPVNKEFCCDEHYYSASGVQMLNILSKNYIWGLVTFCFLSTL